MEKLSVEKRTEVSKMSTERLRARLAKAGYDEDEVFEMDRSELLSTYAEYLLSPPIPEKAEGGAVEEWEFRKQELELRKRCAPQATSRHLGRHLVGFGSVNWKTG